MRILRLVALMGLLLMVSVPFRADVKNVWVGVNGAT